MPHPRTPRPALAPLFVVTALAACDGDGCNGGPSGAATLSCQRSLDGLRDVDAGELQSACAACCVQEVPYRGVVVDGRCVCER